MVEVPAICRDNRRLKEVEDLLQTYKWAMLIPPYSPVDWNVLLVNSVLLINSSKLISQVDFVPAGSCWSEKNDRWREDCVLG
jgi:hypothetical protein